MEEEHGLRHCVDEVEVERRSCPWRWAVEVFHWSEEAVGVVVVHFGSDVVASDHR